MNALQVAQRVCNCLSVPHVTDLEINDREAVIDALNAANRDWHDAVPSYLKQTMISYRAAAPAEYVVDIVAGSRAFAWNPQPAGPISALLGSTVVIEGDSNANILVKSDEFLYPYAGETGNDVAMTLYNNAVPLGYEVPRLVHPPRDMEGRALVPANQAAMVDGFDGMENLRGNVNPRLMPGYALQSLSPSTGEAPYFFIRFFPLPSAGTTYHLVVEKYPEPIRFTDLTQPVAYPVAEQHVTSCIVPLAMEHMITHRLFASDARAVMAMADRARARIRSIAPVNDSPQHGIDSGELNSLRLYR